MLILDGWLYYDENFFCVAVVRNYNCSMPPHHPHPRVLLFAIINIIIYS
jgi:hypothetical protein